MINDIKFVIFKLPETDSFLAWATSWDGDEEDELEMNVIVEMSINEYNGTYTPQCIIKEYEITAQN